MWAAKAILRRSRERVPDASTALAVYFALCELASDNASEEFTATQQVIASKSGLSSKSVQRRIADLVALDAITEDAPKLKGAARFRLLCANGHEVRTIGRNVRTSGHEVRAIGHGTDAPSPISSKREETINKGKPSPIGTPQRIALERQVDSLELEVRQLASLRLHEQKGGHKAELEAKRKSLARFKARLAEGVEAIA